jgi:FixJ family two-component response regulator
MTHGDAAAPRRLSVAIVDDDASVRVSLRRLCEALELSATTYASGADFLAALARGGQAPDCVLLDAQMPGMTGLELQRHLVADRAGIPAVVFTADDTPDVLANYAAAGVAAFLRKPASGDELLAAVAQAVNARPR